MGVSRRNFARLFGFGSIGLALCGGVLIYSNDLEGIILSVLREDLTGLKVREIDMQNFAKEAASLNPWKYDELKIRFINTYRRFGKRHISLPYFHKYIQFRADIVGRFLLSTNYFHDGNLNSNEELRFTGIVYTPYNITCFNPFSNLYHPQ